jgi:hypothetical protein
MLGGSGGVLVGGLTDMVSEVVSLSHWSGVMSLSSSVENNFRWGVFWVSFFYKGKEGGLRFWFRDA